MKRILITGGAGFIGSHLTERLLEQGNRVLVIDNFATSRRDTLIPHPQLELVEGSIADRELVNQVFERFKPEWVVHAAASYKDPNNWVEDVQTNELGTVNIVKASQQAQIKRLIYFQTSLCYGLHPQEQPITLSHPIVPEGSSYAISKTTGEHYIRLSGLEYVSFRLANAYGPRNLSGPLPTFYHRLTEGKPCFVVDTRRDFIYVDDLVEVVLKALDGAGRTGAYHISTGKDYSIKELFDAVTQSLDIQLEKEVEVRERHEDDVFTILIDPSETESDFDWKASTPLNVGVAKAIAWYSEYGISQTYTHLQNLDNKQ